MANSRVFHAKNVVFLVVNKVHRAPGRQGVYGPQYRIFTDVYPKFLKTPVNSGEAYRLNETRPVFYNSKFRALICEEISYTEAGTLLSFGRTWVSNLSAEPYRKYLEENKVYFTHQDGAREATWVM